MSIVRYISLELKGLAMIFVTWTVVDQLVDFGKVMLWLSMGGKQ
jgi:hypothetical protein